MKALEQAALSSAAPTPDREAPRHIPRNIRMLGPRSARGEPKNPRRSKAPKPPAGLEPAAAAHWKQLAPAVAAHWLPSFSTGLAVLCKLLAAADSGEPLTAAYLSQLRLLLIEFGLTPRSHLARMRERSET